MTAPLPFTRIPNPAPATPERVAEVVARPGFGQYFTDHMVTVRWSRAKGWHDARVEPYHDIPLDPAAMVLHYGQAIFEGLKAYRQPDGSIQSFRPEANAERMRASARRMAMPELPDELFLGSLRELIAVDCRWVPEQDEESLYLRPFMFATEAGLGVRPAGEYVYVLIASPAGSYFAGGVKPVSVWLSTEYVRAAPGGTGAAKFAGNYAASLVAQAQAAEKGCDQVVWLDAVERRWVEEMGGMNLAFVFGSGSDARVVTPELSGSLLPGITRDSLLQPGGRPRVPGRGAAGLHRGVGEEGRDRRADRGVRVRHGRGDHAGRVRQARRRRVRHQRRADRRGDHEAARHARPACSAARPRTPAAG